jgi:hypothetical protein
MLSLGNLKAGIIKVLYTLFKENINKSKVIKLKIALCYESPL